jgi:hypothetical protein
MKLKQIVEDYPITLTVSVNGVLSVFASAFTRPSYSVFLLLVMGAILAGRRHTVTRMIMAAGVRGSHHARFHRFFAKARWDPDELWRLFGQLVDQFFEIVGIAIDDTAQKKTGAKIYGAAVVHDNRPTVHKGWDFCWGLTWVVATYHVRVKLWGWHVFAIPALVRLYQNEKLCEKEGRPFKTKTLIALEMVQRLDQWFPGRRFRLHVDGGYAYAPLMKKLPLGMEAVGRVRRDAALFELPPSGKSKSRGRPRQRGQPLPTPQELVPQDDRPWARVRVRRGKKYEVKSWRVLWWSVFGPRPILLVASRRPGRDTTLQFFYSTDLTMTAGEVVQAYDDRWPIEVFFHEIKERMGMEEPQCWTPKAVLRTTPFLVLVAGLVQVWFLSQKDAAAIGFRPRWRNKRRSPKTPPCFSEMLAATRTEILTVTFSATSAPSADLKKNIAALIWQLSQAA